MTAVRSVQIPNLPVIMSKSTILKKAKQKPANPPYALLNGICVASIGSIFGGRNGISRISRHAIKPTTNLKVNDQEGIHRSLAP